MSVRRHSDPKANKLSVVEVDAGDTVGNALQIVCGATNLDAGMLTVCAPLGGA